MIVFFDLDGTLLDSKQRMYYLFQCLVPNSKLSFEEYWKLKKENNNHHYLLKNLFDFDQSNISQFELDWFSMIESEELLKLDKPFIGITEYLLDLKSNSIILFLLTARQLKENVFKQIEKFGWTNIFNEILITEQRINKELLIKPRFKDDDLNWIVSDTGYEIEIGKNLGLKTVAVLSGFQSRNILTTYSPDFIFNSVLEFNPLVLSKNDDQIPRPPKNKPASSKRN